MAGSLPISGGFEGYWDEWILKDEVGALLVKRGGEVDLGWVQIGLLLLVS